MDTKSTYTTADARGILNISRSNFQVYMQNYLTPTAKKPAGQGDAAQWSFWDLLTIKIFLFLLRIGMSRFAAGVCVKRITPELYKDIDYSTKAIWFKFYFDEPNVPSLIKVEEKPKKNDSDESIFDESAGVIGVNLIPLLEDLDVEIRFYENNKK